MRGDRRSGDAGSEKSRKKKGERQGKDGAERVLSRKKTTWQRPGNKNPVIFQIRRKSLEK